MLNLSAVELAKRANVALSTVLEFERGERQLRQTTLQVITKALVKAGVDFIPRNGGGPGVRLRK